MTRLVEDWIKDIDVTIKEYESDLRFKTGLDFVALASAASGVARERIELTAKNSRVGVIPITAGQGIIGYFAESVAAILQCMNFDAFVTACTDVAGIYEAHQKGAKILFFADEDRFLAVNLERNIVAENDQATARGYVAALEAATGNLKDQEVLVIGCGPVGRAVLSNLKQKGAHPVAYDKDKNVLTSLASEGLKIVSDVAIIAKYRLVVDATPEGGWIHKGMLHPEAWIVTPGVPLSLDPEAYAYYKQRVIHDPLHIGVATMAALVCKE